jgi:hypothetical protein
MKNSYEYCLKYEDIFNDLKEYNFNKPARYDLKKFLNT